MNESKRKQYIRALNCAANHADVGMITISVDEAREIADLLTEKEPRVMSFEKIKDNMGVPVWVEYADDENWNGYGVPTSDHEVYIMIYGMNAFCAHNARSYNVKWRCWTSAPTEEQRNVVKWNDRT